MMIKRLVQRAIGWDRKTDEAKYIFNYGVSSALANAISLLPVPMWLLFKMFGSDKHTPGIHSYGHTYQALLRSWKYRRIKLLEIGIGGYQGSLGGRSLLAWQAFFPFATILAADIVPKQILAGRRRHVVQLDQSSPSELDAVCREHGPFDVIIDDGSHFNAHQILTFQHLWEALEDGGLYVIEDVQTSFWPGKVAGVVWDGAHISDPQFSQTCYGFFLELAKYLNHAEFLPSGQVDGTLVRVAKSVKRISFEHNLIVLLKGDNREASAFV